MPEKSGKKSRLSVFGKLGIFLGRARTSPNLEGVLQEILAKLAALKSQCQARHTQEKGNAALLLQKFDYDLAALGAEKVLKEQTMLNVLAIVESHCKLLLDLSETLKHARMCPDNLKEPIWSLIFCSSRLADLPQLQQLSFIIQEKFGGEFMSMDGDHKADKEIMKNLSERKPSFQSAFHIVKDIYAEKSIPISLDALEKALREKFQENATQDEEEEQLLKTVCDINGGSESAAASSSSSSQETVPQKETVGNKNEGMEGSMDNFSMEQRSPILHPVLRKQKSISIFNPTQGKVQSQGNSLWSSKSVIMRAAGYSKGMPTEEWYIQSNSRLLSLKRRRAQSLQILPDALMEEETKDEG